VKKKKWNLKNNYYPPYKMSNNNKDLNNENRKVRYNNQKNKKSSLS